MNLHSLLVLWQERGLLLGGLARTIEIAAISTVLAGLLGLVLFAGLLARQRAIGTAITAMIDLMRCVPFMLFCYLIYYGLPYCGVFIDSLTAGILSLTLYNAAYVAVLLKGAWTQLPRDTVEAGTAFGFHGWRLLWRIVIPPVLTIAVPMLGNQVIQVIKDSAFLVIITVQELTYAANEVQATYYIPFASFICAMLFYWLLCLSVEGGVRLMLRRAGARR